LAGKPTVWPAAVDDRFWQGFLDASSHQGLQGLLYQQLHGTNVWGNLPVAVRDTLTRTAKRQEALELLRAREIANVLGALAERGIRGVLMKGTPLAYSHYPSPGLRTRGDTDLLLAKRDICAAKKILTGLGYTSPNAVSGELVSYQSLFVRTDAHAVSHALDLHWRINNRQLFAASLDFPDVFRAATPVPGLGPHAHGLCPVHALMLACMHRVAHMHAPWHVGSVPQEAGDCLIWLYDIHLLSNRMSPEEFIQFANLATEKGLRTICLDGLLAAQARFETALSEDILGKLSVAGPAERSARYLSAGRLKLLLTELGMLKGWREKFRLLRETALPPRSYICEKYRVSGSALLPALYLHRGLHGIWRYLKAPR
jgi:hypothetical protein